MHPALACRDHGGDTGIWIWQLLVLARTPVHITNGWRPKQAAMARAASQ